MTSILRALSKRLEQIIGADSLSASMRQQLLTEQIQALIHLTPPLTLGAVLVSLPMLVIASATTVFVHFAVWAACVYATLLLSLRTWVAARRNRSRRMAGSNATRRVALYAFAMGCVWGALPVLVFAAGNAEMKFAAGVSMAGVLCATVLGMTVMPVAAIAFAVPVFVGALVALLASSSGTDVNVILMLIFSFAATIPLVGLGMARNFVQHLISEAHIRHQKDIISLLLKEFEENSSDWLWEFDLDGRMDRVSERFASAVGDPGESLRGLNFLSFLLSASTENASIVSDLEHAIAHRVTFHDVVVKLDRGERWWRLSGKPIVGEDGSCTGYVGTASDITSERLAERQINFLAHNDALTGLANRSKFTDHLKQTVSRLERYGSPFAVLYLDLDQFKAVNDSLGHLVGDKLLIQVSRRIRGCIRDSDVAARLGGDEFAIILGSQFANEQIADIAGRLIEAVSKPYEFEEGTVNIGVSIGIALAPVNGTRPDQILRNADLALYRAKAEGKGSYRFFESQMDSDVRERRMLELELREAVKDGQLILYYQPLVEADGKQPSGFEALIRWNHPIRGIIPPAEFIPIAEQTGLIKQIGDWTLEEACRAAVLWPEDVFVAVNLSAKHFQLSDIVGVVRSALEESRLPPHRLELEITESLLMERADEVVVRLTELKTLGVTIAMDDFGTGYSSLSYLLKFPFDKIKIDKSFVTASTEDVVARDILRSIAALGKTLNMRITAEGVETQEQVDFLSDIACHQLQGFYFAKPLDQADLASYFLSKFERDMLDADNRMESIARRAVG